MILMRDKGAIGEKRVRIRGWSNGQKIRLDVVAEGESANLHEFSLETER